MKLFHIISNLSQNKEESEEKVNTLYFLNNSSDSKAKDETYTLSVTKYMAGTEMTITWPAVLTNEYQIGDVTAALCSGVTELINMGCSIREVRGNDGQKELLDGETRLNFDHDKYSVLLM